MRLLVDEDTASATLITRLLAAGHEVVQLPHGTPDEVGFNEAQRLAPPPPVHPRPSLPSSFGSRPKNKPNQALPYAQTASLASTIFFHNPEQSASCLSDHVRRGQLQLSRL